MTSAPRAVATTCAGAPSSFTAAPTFVGSSGSGTMRSAWWSSSTTSSTRPEPSSAMALPSPVVWTRGATAAVAELDALALGAAE